MQRIPSKLLQPFLLQLRRLDFPVKKTTIAVEQPFRPLLVAFPVGRGRKGHAGWQIQAGSRFFRSFCKIQQFRGLQHLDLVRMYILFFVH